MKKNLKKEQILLDDWQAILTLLKTGLPLQECLNLIQNKRNRKIFTKIKRDLNQGLDASKCIEPYICKELKVPFSSFIKLLSLEKSLSLSFDIHNYEAANKNEIIKNLAYPFMMFIFSLTSLYIFEIYGLDSIFNVLRSFKINVDAFEIIRVILKIVMNIIYIALFASMILFLIVRNKKRIVIFYILMVRYMPNSVIQIFYSQEFMSLFSLCYKMGYKTKESIDILKSLKDRPIISFIAYHVDESFLRGSNINEALTNKYLDNRISSFIKIAMISNDFDKIIDNYVEVSKLELNKKIRRYTRMIQISIYLFIGILVIFIYQVLFLPLQAIGQF